MGDLRASTPPDSEHDGASLASYRTSPGNWANPETIAPAVGDLNLKVFRSVQSDDTGTLWFDWSVSRRDRQVRRRMSDGTWSNPTPLQNADSALVVERAGNAIETWRRSDAVLARRWGAAEQAWEDATVLATDRGSGVVGAYGNGQGQGWVAWSEPYSFHLRSWGLGGTWGSERVVEKSSGSDDFPYGFRIDVAPDGSAYLYWGENVTSGGGQGTRCDVAASICETPVPLAFGGTLNPDGTFWEAWSTHGEVRVQRRFPDGSLSEAQVIDDGWQPPALGIDGFGNVTVAWTNSSGIWVRQWVAGTEQWNPEYLVTDQAVDWLTITTDRAGRAVLSWSVEDADTGYTTYWIAVFE